MDRRDKKPPINISDTKEPEHKPGPLGYTGGNGGGRKSGSSLLTVVVFAFLAIIISAFISYQLNQTSRADIVTLNDNVQTLNNQLNGDSGAMKILNNVVSAQGEYAKRTELSGYATQSDLANAKPDLSGYYSKAEVDAMIDEYEAEIASLTVRITTLETPSASTPSKAVTCELKTYGDTVRTGLVAGTSYTLDIPVRATVSNNTGKDLEDVILILAIYSNPSQTFTSGTSLGGGFGTWRVITPSTFPSSSSAVVFSNYWNFDLDAGEVVKKELAVHLEFTASSTTVQFSDIEMECEDFDYAD